MDMAIANLFKHKAHFQLKSEENDIYEPYIPSKGRQYLSNYIENLESIGVSDANDLRLKCLEPFIVHIISTLIREEHNHIDSITATATLIPRDGEYDDYDLVNYTLENPKYCIHLFSSTNEMSIYSFPEHLLTTPFSIFVNVFSYFIPYEIRELDVMARFGITRSQRNDVPSQLPPPDQMYRQDHCVICLESAPNILYLDCMHVAVCASCDRMKRTVGLRKNCDICRAEISRRIKI